jgi:hypothetical protein
MPIASTSATTSATYYLSVRQDWLDRRKEPITKKADLFCGTATRFYRLDLPG